MPMRTTLALPLAASVAAAGAALPIAAASAETSAATTARTATVTVVHGIPNTNVDVYVNGKATLRYFRFKTVTHPLALRAGTYDVAIRPAGAPASGKPILRLRQKLAAGQNASIVAYLSATGAPSVSAFVNPTNATPPGQARLVVRHVAAAPAVDIRAGGKVVIHGLTNPQQRALTVRAGTLNVSVTLPNSSRPVIGPVPLRLHARTTTIVYAIGSARGKSLTTVTQT